MAVVEKRPVTSMDRYSLTPIRSDDFVVPKRIRYTTCRLPDIDMSEVELYTVTVGDLQRPDRIAHKFYGQSSLWWVVCLVNGIGNPLSISQLSVGLELKIPSLSAVNAAFSSR